MEKLTEKLAEIDETIPELPVKDIVRRTVMHTIELVEINLCSRADISRLPRRALQ